MTATQNKAEPESAFVANLVSAAGAVKGYSLNGAFEQLVEALGDWSEDAVPYGAIVTTADLAPTAARAWSTYLSAWDRIAEILAGAPAESLQTTHWMHDISWPQDMRLCSILHTADVHSNAQGIARAYLDKAYSQLTSPVEDVYLLLTPGKLEEMLPSCLPGSLPDARVLIRVIGGRAATRTSANLRVEGRSSLRAPARANSDEDPPPSDGVTLKWRQWFVSHVKCLSAGEVALEGGHNAKNTSATATRWAGDGRIFSVRHAGQLLYPAFQFRHGQPLPVIARILQALGEDPTGWDYAFFLATPNAYLGGDKPMVRLNDKKMEDDLVRLANQYSHPADVF